MQHRWVDVNIDIGEDEPPAECIGGAGDADLWLCPNGVVICQYEDDDAYVSYTRGDAIWDVVSGKLTEENNPDVTGKVGIRPDTPNAFWCGTPWDHNPKEILHYLMCFAPRVFSEAVREEILQAMENGL